jgi:hypothetical protein
MGGEGEEHEERAEKVRPTRDPRDRFDVHRMDREQAGARRRGETAQPLRSGEVEDEQGAQSVENEVGEMEAERPPAPDRMVERIAQEDRGAVEGPKAIVTVAGLPEPDVKIEGSIAGSLTPGLSRIKGRSSQTNPP